MRSRKRWSFRDSLARDAREFDLGPTVTPFVELCRVSRTASAEVADSLSNLPDATTNDFLRQALVYLTLDYEAKHGRVSMDLVELAFERLRCVVIRKVVVGEGDPDVEACLAGIESRWAEQVTTVGYEVSSRL